MLAAIITPAANPRKIRWTVGSGAAPEEKYGGRPQGGEQSGEPCSASGVHITVPRANVLFLSRRGFTRRLDRRGSALTASPLHTMRGGCPGELLQENENLPYPPMQKRRSILE